MAGHSPSPPIDIVAPSKRSSASPQASNLTTALNSTNNTLSPNAAMDIPRSGRASSRPPGRQDSLGIPLSSSSTGARPISVGANPRRDSATIGSYMNGMSWGGKSVSSLFQDDILMGGMSPAFGHSPSFHSSSYLPKMEANFWHGMRCCEIAFSDLHKLMEHYEEVHSQNPSTFPQRASLPGGGRFARRKSSNGTTDSMRWVNQMRSSQTSGANGAHALRSQPSEDGVSNRSNLSTVQDMDTIGEMEMDYEQDQLPINHSTNGHNSPSNQGQKLQSMNPASASRPPPINSNLANMTHGNGNAPSPDATPTTAGHRFRHGNPSVSSVNTPTLSPRATQHQQTPTSPSYPNPATTKISSLSNDFSHLAFQQNGNEMLDLCINDPAKALYTDHGGFNAQQFPHFGFVNGSATYLKDTVNATQDLAGGQPTYFGGGGEEDRPFRCPVIGCEKAYKNANGLRYHEKHGHATQKLQENGDGTFSIVDPITSIPYPGTIGMEKEKPYRCDTCGKRYKNLNGLKYHRNHSPACNPDYNFSTTALPNMDHAALTSEAIY